MKLLLPKTLLKFLFISMLFVGQIVSGQTVVNYTFAGTSGAIDSNISFTTQQNTSANAPAFNTELRLYYAGASPYNGCSITLTPVSGVTITAVEIYATTTSYTPTLRYSIGATTTTASDPMLILGGTTYSVSGLSITSSIKIRNANTGNTQGRLTGVKVTYTPAAPSSPPVVTGGSVSGTVGIPLTNYQIVATNSPASYAIASGTLPAGLTLNTTTGIISGTPTTAGSSSVTVTATNASGISTPAATLSFTIAKGNQSITFVALAAKQYGDANFALTGTASSGLTVTYNSSNTNVATISGNTVMIVGKGSTDITASQAGDANHNAATNVMRPLTITAKAVTITGLSANNKVQDGNTTATLTGTASLNGVVSGDDVTLSGTPTATFANATVGNAKVVTVAGYSLTGTNAANYSLTQLTLTANITALGAPVATAATDVLSDGFTANWNAVTDATSYVLDVYTQSGGEQTIFNTTFDDLMGTGGNDGVWSGSIGTNPLTAYTNAGWSFAGSGGGDGCVKSGTGGSAGSVITPVISGLSGNGVLTFRAASFATDSTVLTVSISGGGSLSGTTVLNLQNSAFSSYTVNIVGGTSNTKLSFTSASGGKRFFIDDIKIVANSLVNTPVSGSPFTIAAPATSYNVTGLNPLTAYKYSVKSVKGSFTSVNSNVIDVTTLAASSACTWNGSVWSNGTGPTSDLDAIIEGDFNTTDNDVFTAKSLTLNSGSFTINSGTNISIVGSLVNNLTAADFVVENNANVVQEGTTNTNIGAITVYRNSAAIKRLDYTLWSSPVVGQGLYAFSKYTLPNRFYTYNSGTDTYSNSVGFDLRNLEYPSPLVVPNGVNGTDFNNVPFAAATGYLIRMPYDHPTSATVWTGTFTGVPNNGDVTIGASSGSYYAIGNPYPSTIDADQFILDNSIGNNPLTPGDGLYFWRKTNNAAVASYATYTTAGGVASLGDTSIVPIEPNGVIQVGEGFIVKATSTTVVFNNGQRIADNSDQFLKTTTIERNRIWLNLSDSASNVNQMMVSYMTGATQGIDAAIDGRYFNDSPTALNSLVNNEEFAIQGRSLPFDASDVVPLAFKATNAGNYSIAIDHVDGLFTGTEQPIYLKDNLTNTINNLSANGYTFASEVGTFNNRFEIVYQTQLVNPSFTANNVVIYTQNNEFVVHSGNTIMASIKVFDIRGRIIEEKTAINANQTTIKGGTSNQVLLVQITSEDGNVVTKKVIR